MNRLQRRANRNRPVACPRILGLSPWFGIALIIVVLLTGCNSEDSADVNQNDIYTEYRTVYEEDHDITYARASFRFGGLLGTALQLSEPATVEFNNQTLAWQPLLAYYELQHSGYVDNGTFTYNDLAGGRFINSIASAAAIDFPFGPIEISQSGAYTFVWQGLSVGTGESVTVTIRNSDFSEIVSFTTVAVGAENLVFSRDKLQRLAVGSARMTLERWVNYTPTQTPPAGGAMWSRYVATPRDVTISP